MDILDQKTGGEIFLTTHKRLSMANFFDIVKQTEKAIQLRSQNSNKTVWLPKTSIKWDDKFRSFYLADWFKKNMEAWQLSILQG